MRRAKMINNAECLFSDKMCFAIALLIMFGAVAIVLMLSIFSTKPMQTDSTTSTISANATTTQNYTAGQRIIVYPGGMIANFQVQKINQNNITGLSYFWYPVARLNGTPTTLYAGNTVGYACDGTLARLTSINGAFAVFTMVSAKKSPYGCPICLSGDAFVSTPNGSFNIKDIRAGMSVWTVDKYGNKYSAPVLKTSKNLVASNHIVVHIVLNDGRQIFGSPGHPTADGRTFANVSAGSALDGSVVASVSFAQYNQSYTYDILPAGDTGFYWADGILVGSTLK